MAKPAPERPVAALREKYNDAVREGIPVRLSHAHTRELLKLLEGWRENPHIVVLGNPPADAELLSDDVRAIEYMHVDYPEETRAFRHDFESNGTELWVLDDGRLLVSHPDKRLWEHF